MPGCYWNNTPSPSKYFCPIWLITKITWYSRSYSPGKANSWLIQICTKTSVITPFFQVSLSSFLGIIRITASSSYHGLPGLKIHYHKLPIEILVYCWAAGQRMRSKRCIIDHTKQSNFDATKKGKNWCLGGFGSIFSCWRACLWT